MELRFKSRRFGSEACKCISTSWSFIPCTSICAGKGGVFKVNLCNFFSWLKLIQAYKMHSMLLWESNYKKMVLRRKLIAIKRLVNNNGTGIEWSFPFKSPGLVSLKLSMLSCCGQGRNLETLIVEVTEVNSALRREALTNYTYLHFSTIWKNRQDTMQIFPSTHRE